MTDIDDKTLARMEKARIKHLHKYWPEDEEEKARIVRLRRAAQARKLSGVRDE